MVPAKWPRMELNYQRTGKSCDYCLKQSSWTSPTSNRLLAQSSDQSHCVPPCLPSRSMDAAVTLYLCPKWLKTIIYRATAGYSEKTESTSEQRSFASIREDINMCFRCNTICVQNNVSLLTSAPVRARVTINYHVLYVCNDYKLSCIEHS